MTTSSDKQSTLILSVVERVPGHFQPNNDSANECKAHLVLSPEISEMSDLVTGFRVRAVDSLSGDESTGNFCPFEQLASTSLKLASATKQMLVFEG